MRSPWDASPDDASLGLRPKWGAAHHPCNELARRLLDQAVPCGGICGVGWGSPAGAPKPGFHDIDDLPDEELEELEDELVDQASAARTIAEVEFEIETLAELERLAKGVRDSGADRKWEELYNCISQFRPSFFCPKLTLNSWNK